MLNRLIFSLCLLSFSQVQAEYAVSIFQATEKNKSVVEIIDNCGKPFRLLISNKDLKDGKALNWLKKLHDNDLLDQCVKTIDN